MITPIQTSMLVLSIVTFVGSVAARPAHATDNTTPSPQTLAIKEEVVLTRRTDSVEPSVTSVNNGERGFVNVRVVSWRDMPFQTVRRQGLDYSCGSAAVATLLTYVYGVQTNEEDVFKTMFNAGDQQKIRREGFSLLDMSNYLNDRGFKAIGYKIDFARVEKERVPFIALINNEGYNHFVVVKSVRHDAVLVGDPNKGNVVYSRAAFTKMWNGIALIVTNNAKKARAGFNDTKEWRHARAAARTNINELTGMDTNIHAASMNTQLAPTGVDIMSPVLNTGGVSAPNIQTR